MTRPPSCSGYLTPVAHGWTRLPPTATRKAVPFRFAQIKTKRSGKTVPKLPTAASGEARFDVSFSGIKTAVRRYVELHDMTERVQQRGRSHARRGTDPRQTA